MEKKIILTKGVDPEKMTFSPGVCAGELLFTSGNAGINKDGTVSEGVEAQARQCFELLGEVLEAAGSSWDKVVKVNCFLTHPKRDFPGWNKVWKEYFPTNPPARTTVGSSLLNRAWVLEVELIAVV
jgi:2-iminobutanoate/2-iminopropanoate deaminase